MPPAARPMILVATFLASSLFAGPSAQAKPGEPSPALRELRFESEPLGRLLLGLDDCVRRHAGKWRHLPYQRGGNFLRARWCRGKGARDDCQIASSSADRRDQSVLELYTLFYPREPQRAFGLGIAALRTPPGAGWAASFSLSQDGKTIVGSGLHLDFDRYPAAEGGRELSVHLGSAGRYKVFESEVTWSSGLRPLEELPLFLESPAAFRKRGLAQTAALEAEVTAALQGKAGRKVEACDFGPYLGGGVPPACHRRPLKPEERKQALEESKRHFAAQRQALESQHQPMFQALLEAFPFRTCWPKPPR